MRCGSVPRLRAGLGLPLRLTAWLLSALALLPLQVPAGLAAETGIRLEVADWVPARNGSYGWWGAVPAGGTPDNPTHKTNTEAMLSLPPGEYDVYWVQDNDNRDNPLRLAAGVKVDSGQVPSVRADSGIKLEVASWVPARNGSYGWWGAVRAGDTPNMPLHWTRTATALLLVPGEYDVYWVQDNDNRDNPLRLAAGVKVDSGQVASVRADSGVKLEVASWVPARNGSYGWWGAVRAGDTPDRPLHWTRTATALLLVPGEYDVYWVQDNDNRDNPLRLAAGVKVDSGQVASVRADSGVKLEVASWVPARNGSYGWWGAVRAGDSPGEPLHWTRTETALLLLPGEYDVYWVQDNNNSDRPLRLAAGVKVESGQVASVRADSGVKLEIASWVPARNGSYGWWGAVRAGDSPGEPVHWTRTETALLLLPGEYDVYWVQDNDNSDRPLRLAAGVKVDSGQVASVRADSGVGLKVPAGTPALNASYGWWGLIRAGGGPDDWVQWSKGRFDLPLLVPPGTYDVFWKQDNDSKPERKKQGVAVGAGQLVTVDLGAPEAAPQVATETAAAPQPATAAAPTAAASAKSVIASFGVTSEGSTGFGANFPEGTSRVDAVYSWKNAPTGLRVDLRWSKEGTVVLEQNEELTEPEGTSRWYILMQAGAALSPGSYRVELLENGQALIPAMTFTIGAADAGEVTADVAAAIRSAEQAGAAPAEGEQLAADDFETPGSGWSVIETDMAKAGYANGLYRIAFAGGPSPLAFGSQLGASYGDVIIEVDATPAPGSPAHPYGLFARAQDQDNFHGFVIASDGSYAVIRVNGRHSALDSPVNAVMAAGVLRPDGQTNRLRLVAEGSNLRFFVNGNLVAEVGKALWAEGGAGVIAVNPGTTPVEIGFDNWRVWRIAAAAAAQPATVDFAQYAPREPSAIKEVALGWAEADEDGYFPDRAGTEFAEGVTQIVVWFRFAGARTGLALAARWYLNDAPLFESDSIPVAQSDGKIWWGMVRDDQMSLAAGAYRVELLEDGKAVTVIPFTVVPRAADATPWVGRGWQPAFDLSDGTYVNDTHRLRLTVPAGWVVGNELVQSVRVLWVMAKLGPDGQSRLTVSILRVKGRELRNAEEFFQDELRDLRATTMTIGGETKPFSEIHEAGPTDREGVYEIVHTLTHDGNRARNIHFVRNGIGYIVSLKAAADASADELAELDAVRRSMGL